MGLLSLLDLIWKGTPKFSKICRWFFSRVESAKGSKSMGECLPKAANICMIDTRPSIQQKTKWIINQGCTKLKFQLLYPPQFWKHFRTILKYCQRCDTTQCISSLSVFHSRFTHRPDSTSWNEPLTSVAFPNAHAPKIISYFECGICDEQVLHDGPREKTTCRSRIEQFCLQCLLCKKTERIFA